MEALDEAEPWLDEQIEKRALLICRHDYWPALTPDRLWELPYDMWGALAVACDRITEDRKQAHEEAQRRARGR